MSGTVEPPRCTCGERVTGYALEFGRRYGVMRCGGTHCKHADSALMRALRELPATPTLNLARRIAVLEQALLAHGIPLPPVEGDPMTQTRGHAPAR